MNKGIKKMVAITASVLGVLSQFPSAFCSGDSETEEMVNGILEPKNFSEKEEKEEKKPFFTISEKYEPFSCGLKAETSTYLKNFVDQYHYNPIPINREYFRRASLFNYYLENIETYVVYPDKPGEMKSFKPLVFSRDIRSFLLKKIHYKANSFYFKNFKNIVESNFGKAYLLPLDVDDDIPKGTLENVGNRRIFENGFKVVIFGTGENEGKKFRFDFDGINFKDIENFVLKGIKTNNTLRYNTLVSKFKFVNIENCYKMTLSKLSKKSLKELVLVRNGNVSSVISLLKKEGITTHTIKKLCRKSIYRCQDAKKVVISDFVVKIIPMFAFDGYTSLSEIVIPNNVKVIGSYAFKNCKNLQSITLPENLEKIEGFAFENCENLEYINIPASVTSLGSAVFKGCTKLKCIDYAGKIYYDFRKFCEDFFKKNA